MSRVPTLEELDLQEPQVPASPNETTRDLQAQPVGASRNRTRLGQVGTFSPLNVHWAREDPVRSRFCFSRSGLGAEVLHL